MQEVSMNSEKRRLLFATWQEEDMKIKKQEIVKAKLVWGSIILIATLTGGLISWGILKIILSLMK